VKASGVLENEGPATGEENEPESMKPAPANGLPEQAPDRQAAPSGNYDDSVIQKQRLENSAVHRVRSGAIMTGPVGGAVALSSQRPSFTRPKREQHKQAQLKRAHPKQGHPAQRAQPNPLVSIALRSNYPNPNPLPDAAASSEETTVCQMDNNELAKEQGLTTANGLVDEARNVKVAHSSLKEGEGLEEFRDRDPNRDPNIPREVCINTRGENGWHAKGLTTPHHRSNRRRGNQSPGRRRESKNAVRIMFTCINPTRRQKQMIDDIGAQLVVSIEEASTATHVIASDGKTKLRRTPKLMICVCRTSQILSIEWLEQSAKEQRVLDTNDFLLLGDKEAEKIYKFSMVETLENGRQARLDRGGVLGEWYVYICSGVAGNNAPSRKELNLLVEATGATLLRSLLVSDTSFDPLKTIIITSDPSTDAQRSGEGVERVTRLGAKLLSTSWLFQTIINQKIGEQREDATPHSGKQRSKRKAVKSPPIQGNRRKSSRKR